MFRAIWLALALAACGGRGGGGGSCTCTEGPKRGSSCCDPDDSSCSGTANACDNFCQVCTSS
jgi:hypothetical protein